MKIQYASDLHLEFKANSRFIKDIPFEVTGDVLVLAGDIGCLNDTVMPKYRFWKWASENYREVLLVPGNHEFHNSYEMNFYGDSWNREILPNVRYHQNEVVRIDDTDFILSTLWSQIDERNKIPIWHEMPDYKQIRYNGAKFSPSDSVAEHLKSLAFIQKSVETSTAEKVVVVTHHAPTFRVMAREMDGSALNSAFYNNLDEFIEDSRINAWIYGHTHSNVDTMIGNTRIVCNQIGYVDNKEHKNGFDGSKFIEV